VGILAGVNATDKVAPAQAVAPLTSIVVIVGVCAHVFIQAITPKNNKTPIRLNNLIKRKSVTLLYAKIVPLQYNNPFSL
jgi:hypothetical protein